MVSDDLIDFWISTVFGYSKKFKNNDQVVGTTVNIEWLFVIELLDLIMSMCAANS